MFRYLFVIGLLFVFVAACSPAAPNEAVSQNADVTETSETVHHEEGDHSDEDADGHDHGEGHADEDDEHRHEEGDHSDEDADGHDHEEGHADEDDEHGHEEGDHSDKDADGHDHEEGHADEDGHEEGDHDHDHEHEDSERREYGAHEHGAAELMIAWSGNDMAIDLETPSYNVLGFEYAPKSDEEKSFLMESMAVLEEDGLLQINPNAECAVVSAAVQSALLEEDSHDEEAHDAEAETHSDIDVSYNLECQQPDNVESVDASQLFAQFPNFEAIQVQWISDTQQSAGILTPDNSVLSFK